MPAKKRAPARITKRDDPEQSERFVEMARELKADESGKKFREALKKISPRKAS